MIRTYNRYIPQPDGTFLRTKLQEPASQGTGPQYSPAPPFHRIPQEEQTASGSPRDFGSFFKNLIPKGLDTEDLIVILLLLLLSQDRGKNGNRAMLTLGAYLFL